MSIDLDAYYRQVCEKNSDVQYVENFKNFLKSYYGKYSMYFFIDYYPSRVNAFIQDVTSFGCLMVGVFYLSDATPCTVILVPVPEDRYLVYELISCTDIHCIKTNIINVNGEKNEKKKRELLERMFVEHKKLFQDFFTF